VVEWWLFWWCCRRGFGQHLRHLGITYLFQWIDAARHQTVARHSRQNRVQRSCGKTQVSAFRVAFVHRAVPSDVCSWSTLPDLNVTVHRHRCKNRCACLRENSLFQNLRLNPMPRPWSRLALRENAVRSTLRHTTSRHRMVSYVYFERKPAPVAFPWRKWAV
jgi:hypothetical protein